MVNSLVKSAAKFNFTETSIEMNKVIFENCKNSAVQINNCELVLDQIGQSNSFEHILNVNTSSVLFTSIIANGNQEKIVLQRSGHLLFTNGCDQFCTYSPQVLAYDDGLE